MKRILCYGAGLDSSAILIYSLYVKDLGIDHILFSNTGNEATGTYITVKRMKLLAQQHGIPFTVVKKDKEDIVTWCKRLGVLPVLPGANHVCSQKFKAEPIERFVRKVYPNEPIVFLIGIEIEETKRLKRFTKPKDKLFRYEYPLVSLNMNRADCKKLLNDNGFSNITKSACAICPFAQIGEIIASRNNAKQWEIIKSVERSFQNTSPKKHKKWIENGKPLNKANRAPPGMWRKDSWLEGSRLFAKRINGKQLSVAEWELAIDNGTVREEL